MKLILKRPWLAIDWESSTEEKVVVIPIPGGQHEVEYIEHPYAYDHHENLVVLKGTLIGLSETMWRSFKGAQHNDYQVILH
ncbi:hypothetical protein KJ910_00710 [Patescibacteria group bacterium]|nr:hypothetical protein [Patescibacteria group bacterium]MBU1907194.1 hypothetical protein [Patescibacteria group bacterium]